MPLEKKPFTPYKLENERTNKNEVISLKINIEERKHLNLLKTHIQQTIS